MHNLINWRLPDDLFKKTDDLLAKFPDVEHVEIKLEKSIEELIAGINLGGFVTDHHEISYDDLELLIKNIGKGEKLTKNGRTIVVYIEDYSGRLSTDDIDCLPVVHVVNCGSITKNSKNFVMTINPDGRFNVVFAETKAGFYCRAKGRVREQKKLRICKSCKKILNKQKHNMLGRFDIPEGNEPWSNDKWAAWNKLDYISRRSNSVETPSRGSINQLRPQAGAKHIDSMGDYTDDWEEISKGKREAADWKCSDCGVNCSKNKDLLHTHHVNRDKKNNTSGNLRVLCYLCHREQGPDHEGLEKGKNQTVWAGANFLINKLRSEQGIKR